NVLTIEAEAPPQAVPAPIPAESSGPQGRTRRASQSGGVVVARPAVIVGAPSVVVGGKKDVVIRSTPAPVPTESLFGNGLISEKSLDEVILAYLSDDGDD